MLAALLTAWVPVAEASGGRGAFTVVALTADDASACATADGAVIVEIDPTDDGLAPYDV